MKREFALGLVMLLCLAAGLLAQQTQTQQQTQQQQTQQQDQQQAQQQTTRPQFRFKVLPHYHDPNYRSGQMIFSQQQMAAVENDYNPQTTSASLRHSGYTLLPDIYENLNVSTASSAHVANIAKRFLAMGDGDIYFYMALDKQGLTPITLGYAGLCDYAQAGSTSSASTGSGGTASASSSRYAWLCGHATPERAVKIGEKWCEDCLQALARLAPSSSDLDRKAALFSLIFAELLSTTEEFEWHPIDIVFRPSSVSLRVIGGDARQRQTGPTAQNISGERILTLMPNYRGAFVRGMQIFVNMSTSGILRTLYHEAAINGMVVARTNTDTQIELGQGHWTVSPNDYVGYSLYRVPFEKAMYIELFIGIALYHVAHTHPHHNNVTGFDIVLNYYRAHRRGLITLVDLIKALDENFAQRAGADELLQRRLFILGILDYLSLMETTRAQFENRLENFWLPPDQLRPVLDAYFATNNGKARINAAFGGVFNLQTNFTQIMNLFSQSVHGTFIRP